MTITLTEGQARVAACAICSELETIVDAYRQGLDLEVIPELVDLSKVGQALLNYAPDTLGPALIAAAEVLDEEGYIPPENTCTACGRSLADCACGDDCCIGL